MNGTVKDNFLRGFSCLNLCLSALRNTVGRYRSLVRLAGSPHNRNLTENSCRIFPNFAHEETSPGVLRLGSVSSLFTKLR